MCFYLDYYLATDHTTRAILQYQDSQSVQTGPKAKSNILTAVHTHCYRLMIMHNETRGVIFFRSSNETDIAMKTPQSRPLQSPLTYSLCYYETQTFSALSLQTLNPVRAQCALNKSISPKLPRPLHSLNKMRPTWQLSLFSINLCTC